MKEGRRRWEGARKKDGRGGWEEMIRRSGEKDEGEGGGWK